jgi:hypothetical protein
MKKQILPFLILNCLLSTSVFANTAETEDSIRTKMAQQIATASASHGGATITYQHIALGYGAVLDATMTFVTGDGMNCKKVGYSIAVCEDQAGNTVPLFSRR